MTNQKNKSSKLNVSFLTKTFGSLLIISTFMVTSGCTTAQTKRGVVGAAIGGAAGLGVSAISGGDIATGAVIGAGAGGALGAITAPESEGGYGTDFYKKKRH